MVLILNSQTKDPELYNKNLKRVQECLEFERKRLNIKVDPGCKVDVLDIATLKWNKGEIVKRTNIAHKDRLGFGLDQRRSSALLHIEYRVDGSKKTGYFKADSILLAPEGYFTAENETNEIGLETRAMDTSLIGNSNSPRNFMRVMSRLNRLLHHSNIDI